MRKALRAALAHVNGGLRAAVRSVGVVSRRLLPARIYAPIHARWRITRTRGLMTRVLGPEYRRSRRLIEIDITYACNLKCFNCNRSCEQAPTTGHMSLAQLPQFVDEWVAAGKVWDRIRILGGEPTIHKQFFEILDLLRAYRCAHAPGTIIEVATNGHGEVVNAAIRRIPADVVIINTAKEGKVQPQFSSFNVAPVDVAAYRRTDYANGCIVTEICGTGLGSGGYYPCAVAAGIDRIFRWNLGRTRLPGDDDGMEAELRRFCAVCGNFKRLPNSPLDGPVKSATWKEAYGRYASDAGPRDDGDA